MRIAHFITDEKFPDAAWDLFEKALPNSNDFFLPSDNKVTKYIKWVPVNFVGLESYKSKSFIDYIEQNYDFVVLHSLNSYNLRLITYAYFTKISFCWIGMGSDYYNLIWKDRLLLEKTKLCFGDKYISILQKFKNSIHRLRKLLLIKRIDFFAPVLRNEYCLLKKELKISTRFPRYVSWNYGTNSRLVDDLNSKIPSFDSTIILLGNSATKTNNHLEAIDFLGNIKENFDGVVCPLSYGEKDYADYIKAYGQKKIGSRFFPVSGFVPYNEYVTMISGCSTAIMNHVRQQAGGNISAMLYYGASIFLREENPLYDHYRELGVKVFAIQALEQNPNLIWVKLTKQEIAFNREKLKKYGGSDASLLKTKELIQRISQRNVQ